MCSLDEEDYLSATFFLMRALSCAHPNQGSKETLVNLFLETRQKDIDMANNQKPRST
jgi:hypothetical protein